VVCALFVASDEKKMGCLQMILFDWIFTLAFTVEAVAKISAWGFYTPRNVDVMSYMQSVQNQVDLFVLLMAIAERFQAGRYIDILFSGTTKVIRLMKVMRPVRLLMRSQGLKTIIEALLSSLKPMAYATLFLIIVCTMFSVTGMAFFRNKFYFCNDMSFDGLLGQGKVECSGEFVDEESSVYGPRVWSRPKWGNHFDSLDSSIVVLFKCLTLNWVQFYSFAQDAYQPDLQPVLGYSMSVASLYFHLFLLVGSFFGLNLFASFMCDTFYSLQGTAQLEEVQASSRWPPPLYAFPTTLLLQSTSSLFGKTKKEKVHICALLAEQQHAADMNRSTVDGGACNASCQQAYQTQGASKQHVLHISSRNACFFAMAEWIR